MKKKIAFLLAGVMAITALPMTVSASTTNRVTNIVANVKEDTYLFEPNYTTDKANGDWVEGGYLSLEVKDTVESNARMTLTLTNAEWAFSEERGSNKTNPFGTDNDHLFAGIIKKDDEPDKGSKNGMPGYTDGATWRKSTNNNVNGVGGTYSTDLYDLVISNVDKKVAYLTIKDDVVIKKDGIIKDGEPYSSNGIFYVPLIVKIKTDTESARLGISSTTKGISSGNHEIATASKTATTTYVYDPQTANTDIPIKALVVKELRSNSMKSCKDDFRYFTLKAPAGFEFDDDDDSKDSSFTDIGISAEGGYADNNTDAKVAAQFRETSAGIDHSTLYVRVTGLENTTTSIRPGVLYFTGLSLVALDNASDGDVMVSISDGVPSTLKWIGSSTSTDGHFELKDAVDEHGNPIKINVWIPGTTTSGSYTVGSNRGLNVSNEKFKAGTRKDYSIAFKTVEDVPELFKGKYDEDQFSEAYHKAAEIEFSEILAQSWWLHRETIFTVPEGVKIRAIEITSDSDKFANTDISNGNVTMEAKSIKVTKLYESTTVQGDTGRGTVTLRPESISFNNLERTSLTDKAKLRMILYLSISPDFDGGDIELTVSGSGVPEDLDSVVIAKAKDPVEIEVAKSTQIEIGLQAQDAADFSVTETEAGVFERGKEVKISLTDKIRSEIYFAMVPNYELTNHEGTDTGVYKMTTPRLNSGSSATSGYVFGENAGTLSYTVTSESSKATTISFTNVQVYVDRTVPQSNKYPYDLVVWGTAVAENYNTKDDRVWDTFDVPGFYEEYTGIVTDNLGNASSPTVSITMGSTEMVVNNEKVQMPTSAFIDPASNSAMLPVRMVAVALGVKEDQIKWVDEDRTVTIYTGSRVIQFQIGSDVIVVNGVASKMVSPDGLPVNAVIKDDYSFIPFRALGNALGVEVSWDAATNTATLGGVQ